MKFNDVNKVVVDGNKELFNQMLDEMCRACDKVDVDKVSDILADVPFDESVLADFGKSIDTLRAIWESFYLMMRVKAFSIVPYVVPQTDNHS